MRKFVDSVWTVLLVNYPRIKECLINVHYISAAMFDLLDQFDEILRDCLNQVQATEK